MYIGCDIVALMIFERNYIEFQNINFMCTFLLVQHLLNSLPFVSNNVVLNIC